MLRFLVPVLLLAALPAASEAQVHETITCSIDPATHALEAAASVKVQPESPRSPVRFLLARDFVIESIDCPVTSFQVEWSVDPAPQPGRFFSNPDEEDRDLLARAQAVTVTPAGGRWGAWALFSIAYRGTVQDSLRAPDRAYSKGFSTTTGILAPEGVYLAGSSLWIPTFVDELLTFELTVKTPRGWECVSQGERTEHVSDREGVTSTWSCPDPMDECYLVAGPFFVETRPFGNVEAMTFLREKDAELSDRYLTATGRYLGMYDDLIGPYPFPKFALVENFWQTGYGMPSFTLLGGQVLRFPWIVNTSYGHEILHNWWGNGVYVDTDGGNWCEGLTAYLADHLYKEQAGPDEARQYRMETLADYLHYVRTEDEIALADFRERHGASTQTIGYGKGMMVFHMLRRTLGEDGFRRGLRDLYETRRFEKAGWDDVRDAFERASGRDLKHFFDLWVGEKGAPLLTLAGARVVRDGSGYRLLAQVRQPIRGYRLEVPVRLESAEGDTTWTVPVTGPVTEIEAALPAFLLADRSHAVRLDLGRRNPTDTLHVEVESRPLTFAVDPDFDLFRRIDPRETPPTLGEILGADTTFVVLPPDADRETVAFAHHWAGPGRTGILSGADLPESLPSPSATIFLELPGEIPPVAPRPDAWVIAGKEVPKRGRTLVFVLRDDEDPGLSMAWIDTTDPSFLAALPRKLPHYGRYSYLVFDHASGQVVEKGIWPVAESPMKVTLAPEGGQE